MDIISPTTVQFFKEFKQTASINWDPTGTYKLWSDWKSERYSNLKENGNPLNQARLFFEWIIVYAISYDGKASLMNPIFTAIGPVIVRATLLVFQFVVRTLIDIWWPAANLNLVAD